MRLEHVQVCGLALGWWCNGALGEAFRRVHRLVLLRGLFRVRARARVGVRVGVRVRLG